MNYSQWIRTTTRNRIYERDGWRCVWCGCDLGLTLGIIMEPNYKPCYYYELWIGTKHWSRYELDDRKAKRLMARWLRLFGKGSDEFGSPTISINRIWMPNGCTVPCVAPTVIENFEGDKTAIKEFCRVWG